jgi:hypothetical protein
MTCVLANTASTALTIDIIPHVGDRVLVVYPRLYNDKMFNVTDSEDDNVKLTVDFSAQGYNLMSGIAILINQCKTSAHKNVITFEDGKVDIKLGYDKNQSKNMFNFSIDENGYFSYTNADNKTKVEVKEAGITMEDKNGCKIVSNSEGVVINGKLKVLK